MSQTSEAFPSLHPTSPGAGTATPSTTAYSGSQASGVVSNGIAHGDAESSKIATTGTDPTLFALNLTSYIFNVGYLGSHWTDIHLTFFDTGANLHRIIIARSPYLGHVMMSTPPSSTIHLSFPDEHITSEAVHIVLQHLYNPSQHLTTPANARSVLATAFFFQGMPELVHHAYVVCRDSLASQSILDYVQWLGPSPPKRVNGHDDTSLSFGTVDLPDGRATPTSEGAEWADYSFARYGDWSIRLKQDVLDYLIRALPASILESSQSLTNDLTFTSLYARLPFDLFKLCVQSPDLPLDSVQSRFSLAKKVIAQRKKLVTQGNMEEAVVLAIKGGESEAAIHLTRKPRRRTALWKVEG